MEKRVLIKIGLMRISVAKKMSLGDAVAKGLDNNPLIPNAQQKRLAVIAATADLKKASAKARTGSDADKEALKASVARFVTVIRAASLFVQVIADKAATVEQARQIIISSGFEARRKKQKTPIPSKVSSVKAMLMAVSGTILVKWKNSKYTCMYILEVSTNPNEESSWKNAGTSVQTSILLENLHFGTVYYFRVLALGVAGTSDPSGIAMGICLP